MASSDPCPDCGLDVPAAASICPHCGRPGRYPNVREAESADNLSALKKRFDASRADAQSRGAESTFDAFEAKAGTAQAVWCKPFGELARLAVSAKQGAGTYYQQIEAEIRVPDGDEWDRLRRLTDEALFPGYKEHIRFAALALDNDGPRSYGPTALTFREGFIAHRASVFEENSVMFMVRRDVKLKDAPKAAGGFRAP